jgi:GlpG protein
LAEVEALNVSIDEDLQPLSEFLWQHGLPHRVTEFRGRQVLWVRAPQQAEVVQAVYEKWRNGEPLPEGPLRLRVPRPATPRLSWWRVPVTFTLVLLSIAGFLVASLDRNLQWLPWLTFFPFDYRGTGLVFGAPGDQYWRLFTPVFLHFGLLHITFNMLWLWDLGRRVELVQSGWRLLGITLLIGIGSNIAQAVYGGVSVFGGMSGVIYGLLGYCWAWGRLQPDPRLLVPTPVLAIMLGWLVICLVGFTEILGVGAVANAAHVGGLVMGLILGAGGALLTGRQR